MLGYVAEKKFHDSFLDHPEITEKSKDDDHNRKKKGDRRIIYRGENEPICLGDHRNIRDSGPACCAGLSSGHYPCFTYPSLS